MFKIRKGGLVIALVCISLFLGILSAPGIEKVGTSAITGGVVAENDVVALWHFDEGYLFDDFSDGTADDWNTSSHINLGVIAVENGELSLLSSSGERIIASKAVEFGKDFTIKGDVNSKYIASEGPEIFISCQKDGASYTLQYDNFQGTNRLYKWKSGVLTTYQQVPFSVPLDSWHKMELVKIGNKIQGLWGGKVIVEGTDSDFMDAACTSFGLGDAWDGSHVHWDNVQLSPSVAGDASGNNNDGTLVNNPAWASDCKVGNCLSFDGVDDYVDLGSGSIAQLNKMTLKTWFKANVVNDGGNNAAVLIGKEGAEGYNNNYYLWLDWGGIAFWIRNNDGVLKGITYPANTDEWHHVAATYDGTDMNLYVNGKLVGTVAQSNLLANSQALRLGRGWGNVHYDGILDESAVYNRALTLEEIRKDAGMSADMDADGILDEDDLCLATDPTASLIIENGCSCEQVKEALAARGKGYARGVLSDKNLGICRAAQVEAKGILAKTGKAVGLGETAGDGVFALVVMISILAVIYLLAKIDRDVISRKK